MILPHLLRLLEGWQPAFQQKRTHHMALSLALATLVLLGRRTVTQRLVVLGHTFGNWSRWYRLFTKRSWTPAALFVQVLRQVFPFMPPRYLVVGGDDTILEKTGKQIHNVSYLRDPQSPKFRHNLILGLRYIQLSVLLPTYHFADTCHQALGLPIRFLFAPVYRLSQSKLKQLSKEERKEYEQIKQEHALPTKMWTLLTDLRAWMDEQGHKTVRLLVVVDNSYCNSTLFGTVTAGIEVLARLRKTARLYLPGQDRETSPGFTPEDARKDETSPWHIGTFHFGGQAASIRYKEVAEVLWPGGAGDRRVRLLVIGAIPYRRTKYARLSYRDPGYLLTTDLTAGVEFLIQSYLDRWQIEVNFREEKTLLGLGDAQVWNAQAVEREPAFTVAAYSLVKWAAYLASGPTRTPEYAGETGWYTGSARPTLEDIQRRLREEVCEHPALLAKYDLQITQTDLIRAARAA